MSFKPITVTQLNTYIKQVFDAEELLHGISVVGEISGWSNVRGTAYFTLKDETSTLSCVCFTADEFSEFKNGDSVMLIGSARFYSKSGKMNFNVVKIQHYGVNILYQKFLELKASLEQKGYFSEERKKAIPKNIKRIGVVSSEGGAVIQDIINIRTRRNPQIDIVLYPVKVQGDGAEKEIAQGINALDNYNVDVIVVARGGGSFEDLQPFNTEIVADATYNCNKPIISAVGHETDYTIIDFCSDLRAPTPSAAAEILCEDVLLQKEMVLSFRSAIFKKMFDYLDKKQTKLLSSIRSIDKQYSYTYEDNKTRLNENLLALNRNSKIYISNAESNLLHKSALLDKLNPQSVLKLGYACVRANNAYKTSVKDLKIGDSVCVQFKDGLINATVNEIKENI